jgi:glycosyltransferase involved in cell wall biosynthesis
LYQQAGQPYGWFCTTAEEEAKGLNRADIVIAIQEQERQYFSTITQKKTITVRHIAPLRELSDVQLDGKKILFVGSDAGTNIHGIRVFIREILPKIRSVFPGLNLLIVGKICDKLDNVDGCVKLGTVEDLASIYRSVDVVVNPIQFSTGLSIKTIEALGHSRPVVTTSSGCKGLEDGANKAFLVADTPEGFTKTVVQILKDPQLSQRLSETAYRFVVRWNNESLRELANAIN